MMPSLVRSVDGLELTDKVVLVRCDLNLPVEEGKVLDLTRIRRLIPSLRELSERGCKVVLLSHFGRPNGRDERRYSLQLVQPILAQELAAPVAFAQDCIGEPARCMVEQMQGGEYLLLENLRFHSGERSNDLAFAQALASLGDCYINDAFASVHREHASTTRLAQLLPSAAGRLIHKELSILGEVLEQPHRPMAAIIGGSKLSTKLMLLKRLAQKVDIMALGGAMANNFLLHHGCQIGASPSERNAPVGEIIEAVAAAGHELWLPSDVVVAPFLQTQAIASQAVAANEVPAGTMILDIGPASVHALAKRLAKCKTLIWNGPLGAFEYPPFDKATTSLARRVAELTRQGQMMSIAGGGDTLAALAQAGVLEDFSYVSTAGGAFLAWLEGRPLPAITALSS